MSLTSFCSEKNNPGKPSTFYRKATANGLQKFIGQTNAIIIKPITLEVI